MTFLFLIPCKISLFDCLDVWWPFIAERLEGGCGVNVNCMVPSWLIASFSLYISCTFLLLYHLSPCLVGLVGKVGAVDWYCLLLFFRLGKAQFVNGYLLLFYFTGVGYGIPGLGCWVIFIIEIEHWRVSLGGTVHKLSGCFGDHAIVRSWAAYN